MHFVTELARYQHFLCYEEIDSFKGVDVFGYRRPSKRPEYAVVEVFTERVSVRAAQKFQLFFVEV